MGEHLPCKQGVKSSNLSISTRYQKIPKAAVCTSETNVSSAACRHAIK